MALWFYGRLQPERSPKPSSKDIIPLNNFQKRSQGPSNAELKTELNTPVSLMSIYNKDPQATDIEMSGNMIRLFGLIEATITREVHVKRLNPNTYFIHCDLMDKRQNLLNGTPSTLLARFDIRGKPFEKVHYQTPQPHVLRDTASSDYDVNSITLAVQDDQGNAFDFNGLPLEFEIEIN